MRDNIIKLQTLVEDYRYNNTMVETSKWIQRDEYLPYIHILFLVQKFGLLLTIPNKFI